VRDIPLDHPTPTRPHRVYVAVTNNCNRSCPWCSTCSSPKGNVWLTADAYRSSFPTEGPFEVQLEGGEPTIHPLFDEFVRIARADARCTRLIVCTNGVALPRTEHDIAAWVAALGDHLTIKLSVNHHLLEKDPQLIALAALLKKVLHGGDRQLVLNVRRRKGTPDDDQWVVDLVRDAGLLEDANVFFLQRYGFAEKHTEWERPFLAGSNFRMVNPDGQVLGTDLIERSEAMRALR